MLTDRILWNAFWKMLCTPRAGCWRRFIGLSLGLIALTIKFSGDLPHTAAYFSVSESDMILTLLSLVDMTGGRFAGDGDVLRV